MSRRIRVKRNGVSAPQAEEVREAPQRVALRKDALEGVPVRVHVTHDEFRTGLSIRVVLNLQRSVFMEEGFFYRHNIISTQRAADRVRDIPGFLEEQIAGLIDDVINRAVRGE